MNALGDYYVLGGTINGNTPQASVEKLSMATGNWELLAQSMPQADAWMWAYSLGQ